MSMLLLFITSFYGKTLEVPEAYHRGAAYWVDLNNDGVLDIWFKGDRRDIWVWDGASETTTFTKLDFEPIHFPVRPAWHEGAWQAQVRVSPELKLAYLGEKGWQALETAGYIPKMRDGAQIIESIHGDLAPTISGYSLFQNDCEVAQLRIAPILSLSARSMKLTFPVPYWHDLNGDNRMDLTTAPIGVRKQGELRIWNSLDLPEGRESNWEALHFPNDLKYLDSKRGDLNGDGFEDLVVIARPASELSIFEEMTFMAYMGTGPGKWEKTPSQVLETKQNIWQTGPIEITEKGILLYYYKGLIRSLFRMDLYRWDPAGFIEPKPKSEGWKMEDASRGFIMMDFDIDEDGHRDMVLKDESGLHVYTRDPKAPIPFSEDRTYTLKSEDGRPMKNQFKGDQINANQTDENHGVVYVQSGKKLEFWQIRRAQNGHWEIERL